MQQDGLDLRYLRHLYVSLGKIVTVNTKEGEKPTALLTEEFNYYIDRRRALILEWLDAQIAFTRNRNSEMIRLNKNSEIPTDIRVLVGAWEFLKSIVTFQYYDLLRQIWNLFEVFGLNENNHTQYSWHLGAILYHWINEGIKDGLIPDNPHHRPFTRPWEQHGDDAEDEHAMEGVCLQLKALQCFLNFTSQDGEQALRREIEAREEGARGSAKPEPRERRRDTPVYLFRLSATVPGMIVLQFMVPSMSKQGSVNVRLEARVMGKGYHFFMSPREYTVACETYIQRATGMATQMMTQVQPTLNEMIGATESYARYFENASLMGNATKIPLKGNLYQ